MSELDWVWNFKKVSAISEASPSSRPVSQNSKARLARVANKTPQCMVKVTGRCKDSGHLKAHLEYVSRNGEVEATRSCGDIDKKELKAIALKWGEDADIYEWPSQRKNIKEAAVSVNMVLSMPPATDRENFKAAVNDFVRDNIANKAETIVCFHDDTKHPHAHLTIRARAKDQKTFNPTKPVLTTYREKFAECLRHRGIEADATARFARGVAQKGERQAVRHMTMRGITPKVVSGAIKNAQKRAQDGNKEQAWEMAAGSRHQAVRGAYLGAAKALLATKNPEDIALAVKTAKFVEQNILPDRPMMKYDSRLNQQQVQPQQPQNRKQDFER